MQGKETFHHVNIVDNKVTEIQFYRPGGEGEFSCFQRNTSESLNVSDWIQQQFRFKGRTIIFLSVGYFFHKKIVRKL